MSGFLLPPPAGRRTGDIPRCRDCDCPLLDRHEIVYALCRTCQARQNRARQRPRAPEIPARVWSCRRNDTP